jgi:hypothetical protein
VTGQERQKIIDAVAELLAEQDGYVVVNEATRNSFRGRAEEIVDVALSGGLRSWQARGGVQ